MPLSVCTNSNQFRCVVRAKVANSLTPCSIQKRPEPQICPKFLPAFAFEGSNEGHWNLSNFCDTFLTHSSPPEWKDQKQLLGQIWTILGFKAFFIRGWRVCNAKVETLCKALPSWCGAHLASLVVRPQLASQLARPGKEGTGELLLALPGMPKPSAFRLPLETCSCVATVMTLGFSYGAGACVEPLVLVTLVLAMSSQKNKPRTTTYNPKKIKTHT